MLTTSEAALLLHVQPKTIAIYINRGLIVAVKRGRDYQIEEQELERFQHVRRSPGNPGTKRGPKR